uniref:Ig-like domain-containing protein n=1 Tax=Pelusios castaneus TaxID=367368 RepID=A0A8C8RQW2_9SAUR
MTSEERQRDVGLFSLQQRRVRVFQGGWIIPHFVFPFPGVLSQVQLIQSGAVKPGETLTVTCAVSGVSITDGKYGWDWIWQLPGKGLEWVGGIYPHGGTTAYSPSLQGRATVTADTSKNQFSFQLRSLTPADSATYYCARNSQ